MYEWTLEPIESAESSIDKAGGSSLLHELRARGYLPVAATGRLGAVPDCPDDTVCGQQHPDLEPELWCVSPGEPLLCASAEEGQVQVELVTIFENGTAAITAQHTTLVARRLADSPEWLQTSEEIGIYWALVDSTSADDLVQAHRALVTGAKHEGPVAPLSTVEDVLTCKRVITRLVDNRGWAEANAILQNIATFSFDEDVTDGELPDPTNDEQQQQYLRECLEDAHETTGGVWSKLWSNVRDTIFDLVRRRPDASETDTLHAWISERAGHDVRPDSQWVVDAALWDEFITVLQTTIAWSDRGEVNAAAALAVQMTMTRDADRKRALYTERHPLDQLRRGPTVPSTRGETHTRWRNWTDDEMERVAAAAAASERGEFDPAMMREESEIMLEAKLQTLGITDASDEDKKAWVDLELRMFQADDEERDAIVAEMMTLSQRFGL